MWEVLGCSVISSLRIHLMYRNGSGIPASAQTAMDACNSDHVGGVAGGVTRSCEQPGSHQTDMTDISIIGPDAPETGMRDTRHMALGCKQ
jgi:hypothetical protein